MINIKINFKKIAYVVSILYLNITHHTAQSAHQQATLVHQRRSALQQFEAEESSYRNLISGEYDEKNKFRHIKEIESKERKIIAIRTLFQECFESLPGSFLRYSELNTPRITLLTTYVRGLKKFEDRLTIETEFDFTLHDPSNLSETKKFKAWFYTQMIKDEQHDRPFNEKTIGLDLSNVPYNNHGDELKKFIEQVKKHQNDRCKTLSEALCDDTH